MFIKHAFIAFAQVLSAVAYLHSHRIVHEDLNAESVFIRMLECELPQVKLISSSKSKPLPAKSRWCCWTQLEKEFSFDLWSVGALTHHLLSGLCQSMRNGTLLCSFELTQIYFNFQTFRLIRFHAWKWNQPNFRTNLHVGIKSVRMQSNSSTYR